MLLAKGFIPQALRFIKLKKCPLSILELKRTDNGHKNGNKQFSYLPVTDFIDLSEISFVMFFKLETSSENPSESYITLPCPFSIK